jgi:hypothetical protein
MHLFLHVVNILSLYGDVFPKLPAQNAALIMAALQNATFFLTARPMKHFFLSVMHHIGL